MEDQAGSPGVGNDDGILTAYLDGELEPQQRAALEARLLAEPALKVRLDALARGGRPFGPAFAALLEAAPEERLAAKLAELVARHSAVENRRAYSSWRVLAAVAAAVVVFAAGGAAGNLLPGLFHKAPAQPGWRQVVAEYQGLTTTETLAAIHDDPAAIGSELSTIGTKLNVELTSDKLSLPDVALKRVQLFEFRGRPLAQIAYLSPADGPIALCIIANGRPDEKPAFETREGFNIVFWTDNGRGYMLIGKAPRQELETFAEGLEQKV